MGRRPRTGHPASAYQHEKDTFVRWLSDEIGPRAGDIKDAKLPDDFAVDYDRVYDLVPVEK